MIWRKKNLNGSKFLVFPHCVREKSRNFRTIVWKNEKVTLTQNFSRQINYSVILLVKSLFSRNFCQRRVRVNIRNFHTAASVEKREILSHWKKFRQINYLVICLVNPLLSRNFCEKKCEREFLQFPHYALRTPWKIRTVFSYVKNIASAWKFISRKILVAEKGPKFSHCVFT